MQSNIAPNCMVVTPHHLATQSALKILRDGGTAMEAMVSAAATIAVVYPHMNSIGGDGFWLIVPPTGDPIVIEACGAAGSLATDEFFKGLDKIPYKGPKSASTVAGTVGGWQEVLNYVTESGYQRISIAKLLEDAIRYADEGYPFTNSQRISTLSQVKCGVTKDFADVFIPDGKIPNVGDKFCQKQLANTLRRLAADGLNSFYKGDLAKDIAADLSLLGFPITSADLENYTPVKKTPLTLQLKTGEIFNLPPPTQGLVSLAILGVLEKLNVDGKNDGEFIHAAVEATKKTFKLRDTYITDPKYMTVDPKSLITNRSLLDMANSVDLNVASRFVKGKGTSDTIWMGAMDNKGYSVSFIQSIYQEFGSAVVLPRTGILWQNRGTAFTLEKNHILSIKPGKKPFHTLNVAAAKLNDGRVMIYGTRGGDGQPQTQAAIFHRYVIQGLDLQTSVSAPRWLYGTTSGDSDETLKVEGRFSEDTIKYLRDRGHDILVLPKYSEIVGQAGALVRHCNGVMEGAFDPRSNGSAAGF